MTGLTVGLYTNAELAEWFGIKEGTFKNKKKDKLKELEQYAKFREEKGKVIIEKVYIPFYDKQLGTPKDTVMKMVPELWSDTMIDTVSNVGRKISDAGLVPALAERTIINYARDGRTKYFGKPWKEAGSLGECKFVWCKWDMDDNGYDVFTPFTPEEIEIKNKIKKLYFGEDMEDKSLIVKEMVDKGEIRKEDAWDLYEALSGLDVNYKGFLAALGQALGGYCIRTATQIEYLESWEDK